MLSQLANLLLSGGFHSQGPFLVLNGSSGSGPDFCISGFSKNKGEGQNAVPRLSVTPLRSFPGKLTFH